MKKFLMAATALAVSGGAFAAAPASAQDHADAEGFQLKIGGFYNALAIVRDQDDPIVGFETDAAGDVTGVNEADIRSYDFSQRGRYIITGSQTLDNGLELGFQSQHEITTSFETDRAYVFASGGFGRIHFGADRSAMYRLYEWTPTAGWGIDFTSHDDGVAGMNGQGYPTAAPFIANQDLMLTYITPRFAGIQAGVSFVPDNDSSPQANDNQRFITNKDDLDAFENIVEVGLNYSQSFDGFDLGWSGGFGTAEVSDGNSAESHLDDDRRYLYSTALNVGFGGFNIGASYRFDTHGSANGLVRGNLRDGGSVTSDGVIGSDFDDAYGTDYEGDLVGLKNQHSVNAGITYTTGPWTIGPSFGWTKESAGFERETLLGDLGARYALAPGADLVGSVQYIEYDEGDLPDDFGGEGFAGMFGIQLNF